MKTTKQEKAQAYQDLLKYRGQQVAAAVKSVSKSGMSRRIEFYGPDFRRIGGDIANLLEYSYDYTKGMRVDGCGMDMIFSVLSNLNYEMAQRDTGKTIQELLKTKECGEHIYDTYFVNANNYQTL
jgi:hypothetical protein